MRWQEEPAAADNRNSLMFISLEDRGKGCRADCLLQ